MSLCLRRRQQSRSYYGAATASCTVSGGPGGGGGCGTVNLTDASSLLDRRSLATTASYGDGGKGGVFVAFLLDASIKSSVAYGRCQQVASRTHGVIKPRVDNLRRVLKHE